MYIPSTRFTRVLNFTGVYRNLGSPLTALLRRSVLSSRTAHTLQSRYRIGLLGTDLSSGCLTRSFLKSFVALQGLPWRRQDFRHAYIKIPFTLVQQFCKKMRRQISFNLTRPSSRRLDRQVFHWTLFHLQTRDWMPAPAATVVGSHTPDLNAQQGKQYVVRATVSGTSHKSVRARARD